MVIPVSALAGFTPEQLKQYTLVNLPNRPGFIELREKPRLSQAVTQKRKNSTNALMLAEANRIASKELADPIRRMRWEERHQKALSELHRHGVGTTARHRRSLSNPLANKQKVPVRLRDFIVSELMQGRPLD